MGAERMQQEHSLGFGRCRFQRHQKQQNAGQVKPMQRTRPYSDHCAA